MAEVKVYSRLVSDRIPEIIEATGKKAAREDTRTTGYTDARGGHRQEFLCYNAGSGLVRGY